MAQESCLIVNGWSIYAHPVFLDQLDALIQEVEHQKQKDGKNYRQKNCTKRLAAIRKLVCEVIPEDPTAAKFRQGKTLGQEFKHWFRAKFFQQYRLFFRYHLEKRVIVLAWVNDDASLRSYGSKFDAYAIFKAKLQDGNPPDNLEDLVREAKATGARLAAVTEAED
jgi:toxin YhaV